MWNDSIDKTGPTVVTHVSFLAHSYHNCCTTKFLF